MPVGEEAWKAGLADEGKRKAPAAAALSLLWHWSCGVCACRAVAASVRVPGGAVVCNTSGTYVDLAPI